MTAIVKPEESLYDSAPEELKPTLDDLVKQVQSDANWKVRKKTLLDVLSVLDAATEMTEEQRLELDRVMRGIEEGTITPEEAERALEMLEMAPDAEVSEDEDEVAASADVLPVFIGAILERLGEERIVCVEQAAIYLLSAHDEHAAAAEQWLQDDPKHGKAFKKLLRSDRRYEALFELILAPDLDEDDLDDDDLDEDKDDRP
ncbi:MAG TPA: hypothetical protein VGE72_22970 [Azospirillum sp.]